MIDQQTTTTKLCYMCLEIKPVTAFGKWIGSNDGLRFYCKECNNKQIHDYREVLRKRQTVVMKVSKVCSTCQIEKLASEFTKSNCTPDGLAQLCWECDKARSLLRKLKKTILLESDQLCFYCGTTLTENNQTVDHVIPKSRGGSDDVTNLVPCCFSCNASKKNLLLSEWIRR